MSITLTPPGGSPAAVTTPLALPAATRRMPLIPPLTYPGRHRLPGAPLTGWKRRPGRRQEPWTPARRRADAVGLRIDGGRR